MLVHKPALSQRLLLFSLLKCALFTLHESVEDSLVRPVGSGHHMEELSAIQRLHKKRFCRRHEDASRCKYPPSFSSPKTEAAVEVIDGFPVNIVTNVCLSVGIIGIFSPSAETPALHNFTHQRYNFRVNQLNKSHAIDDPEVKWLDGTTFLLDTAMYNPHYYHTMVKSAQLWAFRRHLPSSMAIDHVINPLQGSPFQPRAGNWQPPVSEVYTTMLGDLLNKTYHRNDLLAAHKKMICAKKVLDIRSASRIFWSDHEVDMPAWNTFIRGHFPEVAPLETPCPPAEAVVLGRTEGKGMRRILNYEVIEKVLIKLGVSSYRNVSLDGSVPFPQQILSWQKFGLVLSASGTQVMNMNFAPAGTALLIFHNANEQEDHRMRFTPESRYPNCYCVEESCPVVHQDSGPHIVDPASTKDKRRVGLTADFWVNETLLEIDLKRLLVKQAQICPGLWD
ncbi:hypothetical protein CYMTET_23153 [Cymbomonas tetramitiformis]|uniref:Glycosyltransferase 61 catalytic domain-containing protein n=1 Tax=Cymbomonas tetramitiformis TaxID=36881 RepID=A0AAE0L1E2_9CHLO|nr:hypothetical protein CYMTET_23153 [Cymbomonas tetramitiformis]